MSKHTISAKAERAELAARMNDVSLQLEDYTGCICDAISEIADGDVSVYTGPQIAYAMEHPGEARDAVAEGLALSGRDYFEAHPNNDFEDYTAHVGVAAWYMDAERRIYDDLAEAVEYAVLGHLAEEFGDELDAAALDNVRTVHDLDWEDNNEDLGDILDEAADIYRETIEDADELQEVA